MPEETTIFEAGETKVTNLRAVFGAKTYAVSNITAVETETQPPSLFIPAVFVVVGGLLVLVFLSNLFANNSYNAATPQGVYWAMLIIGAILLILGVGFLRGAKPTYIVKISTASGEVRAHVSADQSLINKIVESLNTAIVQKG